MKAQDFDSKFEAGEDLTEHLNFSKARRVNQESRRVNPSWVVEGLDKQAKRLGITRQALVKVWIAERLREEV